MKEEIHARLKRETQNVISIRKRDEQTKTLWFLLRPLISSHVDDLEADIRYNARWSGRTRSFMKLGIANVSILPKNEQMLYLYIWYCGLWCTLLFPWPSLAQCTEHQPTLHWTPPLDDSSYFVQDPDSLSLPCGSQTQPFLEESSFKYLCLDLF